MATTGQQLNFIILMIYLLLHTVLSDQLTTDDFYMDPSANEELDTTDDTIETLTLPINITNIRSYPTTHVYSDIRILKGLFGLGIGSGNPSIYMMRAIATDLPAGRVIVQFSTNSTLLARAQQDIDATDTNAPTHLILMDNIDVGGYTSTNRSTFQGVLATNGRYSYLIIQIVSVEPVLATYSSPAAFMFLSDGVSRYEFPYASDILNAPTMTNVGVPGKYVIDLNEEAPPCPCKERIFTVICEHIRQKGQRLPQSCIN